MSLLDIGFGAHLNTDHIVAIVPYRNTVARKYFMGQTRAGNVLPTEHGLVKGSLQSILICVDGTVAGSLVAPEALTERWKA